MRPTDWMNRREVDHIESELCYLGNAALNVGERPVDIRARRLRARKELVPSRKTRAFAIHRNGKFALVTRGACTIGIALRESNHRCSEQRFDAAVAQRTREQLTIGVRAHAFERCFENEPAFGELELDVLTRFIFLASPLGPRAVTIGPAFERVLPTSDPIEHKRTFPTIVQPRLQRGLTPHIVFWGTV